MDLEEIRIKLQDRKRGEEGVEIIKIGERVMLAMGGADMLAQRPLVMGGLL